MCELKFRQWAQYSEHCHRKLLSILLYSYFSVDDVKLRGKKIIINPNLILFSISLLHTQPEREKERTCLDFPLSHDFPKKWFYFHHFENDARSAFI